MRRKCKIEFEIETADFIVDMNNDDILLSYLQEVANGFELAPTESAAKGSQVLIATDTSERTISCN